MRHVLLAPLALLAASTVAPVTPVASAVRRTPPTARPTWTSSTD
ncbi:hypothetical protein ABZX12_33730 [Kribbella sp. NPDC003505]